MKVILDNQSTDSIKLSDVTNEHIIVAIIQSKPCIMGKGSYESEENTSFFLLAGSFSGGNITRGNCHSYTRHFTIQDKIRVVVQEGHKVEVFEQKDWKKALQWLIDNATI